MKRFRETESENSDILHIYNALTSVDTLSVGPVPVRNMATYDINPMDIPPFIPLQPPPPGVTSNFENPDMTRYNTVVATVSTTLTIALMFVLTRLYTRIFMIRHFGWDDGETVPASIKPK